MKYFLLFSHFLILTFFHSFLFSQPIKVLVVIAHPDDESAFAVTLYKIAKEQKGIVDIAVITNGEAGFKYSTLAENFYNLELTDEKTGRENLPRIRKQELMNAGKILGVRNYYFFDQQDAKYNLDEHDPLDTSWNTAWVQARLKELVSANQYNFVFTLVPQTTTHAGHKAATILALRAVNSLPVNERPVILAASVFRKTDTLQKFHQLYHYKETETVEDTALFKTDRTTSFGFKNQLNYKIISNWEIAEHKSQGVMQKAMNEGDEEIFWLYKINQPKAFSLAQQLFNQLVTVPYKAKTY
jgi:LmbE family N-acetylglucosaminyl deacetylase